MKKIILTVIFGGALSISLSAQPGRGNPDIQPTPIDGGISLLIAAGAALGGKKAFDAYKAKDSE